MQYTDHLGNTFPYLTPMCKHWGISRTTFHYRQKRGWSLEKTLATKGHQISDPFGNIYPNNPALCQAYEVKLELYEKRINRQKWSQIEALNLIPHIDHRYKNIHLIENITVVRNIRHKNKPTQYYEISICNEQSIMTYAAIIELCTNILRKEHENGK